MQPNLINIFIQPTSAPVFFLFLTTERCCMSLMFVKVLHCNTREMAKTVLKSQSISSLGVEPGKISIIDTVSVFFSWPASKSKKCLMKIIYVFSLFQITPVVKLINISLQNTLGALYWEELSWASCTALRCCMFMQVNVCYLYLKGNL